MQFSSTFIYSKLRNCKKCNKSPLFGCIAFLDYKPHIQSVIGWYFEENSNFFTFLLTYVIIRYTQIIYFLQYLGFEYMKVDENCTKDVLLGLIHLYWSSLLSVFQLKYNKINTRLIIWDTAHNFSWEFINLNLPAFCLARYRHSNNVTG